MLCYLYFKWSFIILFCISRLIRARKFSFINNNEGIALFFVTSLKFAEILYIFVYF